MRVGQQAVHQHRRGRKRRPQLVRRRGHEVGLQPRQMQMPAQARPHGHGGKRDQHHAHQRGAPHRLSAAGRRRPRAHRRRAARRRAASLAARDRRRSLRRRRALGLLRGKRDEGHASGLHLVEEVVHHLLEPPGAIERHDAAVVGRERPHAGHGGFAECARQRRRTFGVHQIDRQPQGGLRGQEHVGVVRAQFVHLLQPAAGVPVGKHHVAARIEHDEPFGQTAGDQLFEALGGGASPGEPGRVGPPQRIEPGAHEAQLPAIRLSHPLPRRLAFGRHGGVHEPEDERGGHQRQQHEEAEEPRGHAIRKCGSLQPAIQIMALVSGVTKG